MREAELLSLRRRGIKASRQRGIKQKEGEENREWTGKEFSVNSCQISVKAVEEYREENRE